MTDFENYGNFKVIGPGMGQFSTSEMKLTSTTMSFNSAAAAELGYPDVVIMLASPDAKYLLVQVYNKDNCEFNFRPIKFYDRMTQPKRVVIKDKPSVQSLRVERQWLDNTIWRIPGIKLNNTALIFDLENAYCGRGKPSKKVLSLSNYPTLNEIKRTYTPIGALPAAVPIVIGS